MEDTLVFFGDAVKALDDNGRVGGIGIRFSEKPRPRKDLSQEYFTAKTYLGPKDGDGQEALFEHGYPVDSGLEEFASHTFAPVKAVRQKVGIWAETVLNLADEYEKAVFDMAKRGKLGWSSGSAGHRVKKNADGEITSWPVAEWSLTPRPCEPANYGSVLPIKSLASITFVDLKANMDPAEDMVKCPDCGTMNKSTATECKSCGAKMPAAKSAKATWSTATVNDLPDSSFLYIEAGGDKDGDGKTTPRSLRHFPYKDSSGKVDLPHLRNALARIPQSSLPQDVKDKVTAKAQKIAKANGVGGKEKSLASQLVRRLADLVEDGQERPRIIKRIAQDGLMDTGDVEKMLAGELHPTNPQLKSFARMLGIDFEQLKQIAAKSVPVTIKGIFESALAEEMAEMPCAYELWSIYNGVIKDVATVADASQATGTPFDLNSKVREATDEYAVRLNSSVVKQIQDWMSGEDADEMSYDPDDFYLKAILRPEHMPVVTTGLSLDDHSQLAVAALKGIATRFRKNHDARKRESSGNPLKAGRVLSEKNRQRLASLVASIKQSVSDCEALLEETAPVATDEQKRAALSKVARLRVEIAQLGA